MGSLLLIPFARVTQLEDGMGDAGKCQGAHAEVGASHWGFLIPQLCWGLKGEGRRGLGERANIC